MEEGEEDDHERPGTITSRRPWQPGTLISKISRTVRGGEEVARNVRKGCRTLDKKENKKVDPTFVFPRTNNTSPAGPREQETNKSNDMNCI
jgi:hypothetical protein